MGWIELLYDSRATSSSCMVWRYVLVALQTINRNEVLMIVLMFAYSMIVDWISSVRNAHCDHTLTFLSANLSGNIWITPPLEITGDGSVLLLVVVFSDFVLKLKKNTNDVKMQRQWVIV